MFGEFIQAEEQGSVSLRKIGWLLGFCTVVGAVIDTSAAVHSKTKLEAVVDASSHRGTIDSFPFPHDSHHSAATPVDVNANGDRDGRGEDIATGSWSEETQTSASGAEIIPYRAAILYDGFFRVAAHRNGSRANALATDPLQLTGLDTRGIRTASIANYSDDIGTANRCRNNGLIAGDLMEQTSNNTLTNDICVHGEQRFKTTRVNVVTCGVQLSTASPENWVTGRPAIAATGDCNTDYRDLTVDEIVRQSVEIQSVESVADLEYDNVKQMLDAFIAGQTVEDPFVNTIPPYINRVEFLGVQVFNQLSRVNDIVSGGSDSDAKHKPGSHNLVPGTLYVVTGCNVNGDQKLKLEGIVRNIGVYTDCEIDVVKNKDVSAAKPTKTASGTHALCGPDDSDCPNVGWEIEIVQPNHDCAGAVAAGFESYASLLDTATDRTYRDGETVDTNAQACGIEPGATGVWDNVFIFTTHNESGIRDRRSITFPSNFQIGRLDGCREGGGVRIYVGGSMRTSSGTTIHGAHIMALGDVDLAAKANGVYGITVDAMDDIKYSAQGQMGGCPADAELLASDVILTVRPSVLAD